MKYQNDAVQLSLQDVRRLLTQMEEYQLMGITLKANYCMATDCIGSQEWKAAHDKRGHTCKICKPVKQFDN